MMQRKAAHRSGGTLIGWDSSYVSIQLEIMLRPPKGTPWALPQALAFARTSVSIIPVHYYCMFPETMVFVSVSTSRISFPTLTTTKLKFNVLYP